MSRHSAGLRRFRQRCLVVLSSGGRLPCGICGLLILTKETFSIDHIVPLSRGGANRPYNFQPAHVRCNQQKADTLPDLKSPPGRKTVLNRLRDAA